MDCNYTLKRKRGRTSRKVKENSASFFKIILQSTLDKKKMRLPHLFVDKNGEKLISRPVVTLIDPVNRTWPVSLTSDGDVWFDGDGWIELVEFYSIRHGHFIVFEYDGKSRFVFKIFDKSTCEIDYKSCENKAIIDEEAANNTVKVEHIDVDDDEEEEEDDQNDDDPIKFLHGGNKLVIPTGGDDRSEVESYVSRSFWFKGKSGYSGDERRRAVNALKTINPLAPNFLLLTKKTPVLCMPAAFSKVHFNSEMSDQTVTIVDDQGRNWPISLSRRPGTEGFMMNLINFTRGAKVKIGEVLIFELTRADGSELKVFRFPPPLN